MATAPPSEFRSYVKNISHQSSVFLLGTLFSTAAGYFFKIYLARVLGAEALGIYALGMTVVGFAGILAAVGLPQTASRFVAIYSATAEAGKLGRFLWSALSLLLASNLLVGLVVLVVKSWIAGRFYHTPALAGYMHWFVLIMLTGGLDLLPWAGARGIQRRGPAHGDHQFHRPNPDDGVLDRAAHRGIRPQRISGCPNCQRPGRAASSRTGNLETQPRAGAHAFVRPADPGARSRLVFDGVLWRAGTAAAHDTRPGDRGAHQPCPELAVDPRVGR